TFLLWIKGRNSAGLMSPHDFRPCFIAAGFSFRLPQADNNRVRKKPSQTTGHRNEEWRGYEKDRFNDGHHPAARRPDRRPGGFRSVFASRQQRPRRGFSPVTVGIPGGLRGKRQ